ncbi:nucleotidyltransferase [Meiothermus sp.]|uniref:nucleotidyltransferase n=1 Tax=Meiothermus sp. TaxID=1955249 RepID=UPI00307D36C5
MTREMLNFIRCLDNQGARSMVIGGYALAFLGVPRFTKDLDLWVGLSEAPLVLRAIQTFFGGDDLGLTLEDLSTPGVVQLGYEPNQIDLVLLSGPDFDQAYQRSQIYRVEGLPVRVVSREDFIALKKAFGRSIDLRDIEEL